MRAETAQIRSNGQVTLPASVRRNANLSEGDVVECRVLDDGSVLLQPIAVMDRLQADLMLRSQTLDMGSDAPDGLRERALELARRRHLPPLTGRRLEALIERFERGEFGKKRFVSEALILGLPVSVLSTLLGGHLPHHPAFSVGGLLQAPADAPPGGRPQVRISQAFHSLLYLPLYIAQDVGFFHDEGIDVQLETAGGGPEAWSAVAAGVSHYSVNDPVFAVRAFEQGFTEAVVTGAVCNGQAIMAVTSAESLAATEDPATFVTSTLAGRTVATQPEPDSQWAVLRFLGFLFDVQMGREYLNLQVPIGSEPDAVLAGRADVALAFPPAADIAMANGLHAVFDASKFLGPFLLSALCSRRDYVRDNPFAHHAVMRALERACQYAHAYPHDAVRIAQQQFAEADPDTIAAATWRCLRRNFVPEHVAVDEEAWRENCIINRFVGTLHSYHELSEMVDNDAALSAYRSLGNLRLSQEQSVAPAG